jgi:hypothetical protein
MSPPPLRSPALPSPHSPPHTTNSPLSPPPREQSRVRARAAHVTVLRPLCRGLVLSCGVHQRHIGAVPSRLLLQRRLRRARGVRGRPVRQRLQPALVAVQRAVPRGVLLRTYVHTACSRAARLRSRQRSGGSGRGVFVCGWRSFPTVRAPVGAAVRSMFMQWFATPRLCPLLLCCLDDPTIFPAAATVNPTPCGNATVYCPVGSLAPALVQGGFYSAPAPGVVTNATNVMAQQLECPAGCVCVRRTGWSCRVGKGGWVRFSWYRRRACVLRARPSSCAAPALPKAPVQSRPPPCRHPAALHLPVPRPCTPRAHRPCQLLLQQRQPRGLPRRHLPVRASTQQPR